MRYFSWKALPIILFVLLGVFLWRGLSLNPYHLPSAQLGKPLPEFNLPQLDNSAVIFNAKQMRGSVALLNVWASWCDACITEQVFLMQLAREGVTLYGLNYKDDPLDAKKWLKQWGNPYKLIVSDIHGMAAIDLGVYGAPETFIIDKEGIIRYRHAGIMTQEIWQTQIQPLMQQLER